MSFSMTSLSRRPTRVRSRLKTLEARAFYLFITPWLLGFVLFYLGPLLVSFLVSLTDWDLLSAPRFLGLENYRRIFTSDPLFDQSLKVTLVYTLTYVPLDLLLGLLAALLLNRARRGIGVFRTLFYLPSVLTGAAYILMWMWIFHPTLGLVNTALKVFGLTGPRWLLDPRTALVALLVMSVFQVGRSMVIFLAGLKDIPPDLNEAGEVDGANAWQRFWRISLPLLTPSILFNLLFGLIMTFQSFTSVYIATNGGPLNATLFYVLYLYQRAFQYLQMGYASALAWILFLLILGLTLLIYLTSGRWVFYQSGGDNDL